MSTFSGSTQMPNGHDLIDLSYLTEITGGDNELRGELIYMFEMETKIQLEQIRDSALPLDAPRLKQTIHKYRSSLFSVGLLNTANKYKEIETSLKENRPIDNLPVMLTTLERESHAGLQALKTL
jgi:HPt (histidine-containing phosphotransfer) domain-containing protein